MPEDHQRRPRHQDNPDVEAELQERADGAHSEQVTDEANLRADPDPPGAHDSDRAEAEEGG